MFFYMTDKQDNINNQNFYKSYQSAGIKWRGITIVKILYKAM